MKWGEYSSDVQFILQQTDQQSNKQQHPQLQQQHPQQQHPQHIIQSQQQIARQLQKKLKESDQSSPQPQPSPVLIQPIEDKNRNNIRRTTPTDGINDNKEIGIVKGIPQKKPASPKILHARLPSETSTDTTTTTNSIMPEYAFVNKKRPSEFKSADVRNSLDRKTSNVNQELNLLEVFSVRTNNSLDAIKTPIGVSANGALVPPPYRDPPPPRSSPLNYSNCSSVSGSSGTNNNCSMHSGLNDVSELNELLLNNAQYKDLLQLIKFQREKISIQQADLTKVSEIRSLL